MKEVEFGKLMTDSGVTTFHNNYMGWRAIQFNIDIYSKPKGFKQWIHFLWGSDIWYNNIPIIKSFAIVNIIVWLMFFILI